MIKIKKNKIFSLICKIIYKRTYPLVSCGVCGVARQGVGKIVMISNE